MNHDVIIERQCWKNIAKGGHKLNNGIVSLTLIFLLPDYTGRGVRRHKKPFLKDFFVFRKKTQIRSKKEPGGY